MIVGELAYLEVGLRYTFVDFVTVVSDMTTKLDKLSRSTF